MKKTSIGGLQVDSLTCQEWVDLFFKQCSESTATNRFYTSANGNVVSQYNSNARLKSIIDNADGVDADGMSLVFASRIFSKTPLPERVVTTDFYHGLLSDVRSMHGLKVFLLGGTEAENEQSIIYTKEKFPHVEVQGYHGYINETNLSDVFNKIDDFSPDILFIGMGVPLEHYFIELNRHRFKSAKWIKTCGGMFKVLSGGVKRPPAWMGKYGLEWLYRCLQEPRHVLPRYLKTNPHTLWMFLKYRDK